MPMNQLINISIRKYILIGFTSICLLQIAAFSQEVSTRQNKSDTRKIYYQTVEVNKLLKNGDNTGVILQANAIIDSFPQLVCQTPISDT